MYAKNSPPGALAYNGPMTSDALQPWLAHVARERAQALARACEAEAWVERPERLRLVRLAARRLRSALELMEASAPPGALKAARRWTRELGRLRSLDVLARLLEESQSRVGGLPVQAAAEHLLEALARERRRAARRLEARLGAPPEPGGAPGLPATPPPGVLWAELTPLLREALEPLTGACAAGDLEALHRLRLATKRLRYALEVLGPAFRTPPDQALLALKALQDALGQLHDWSELRARVEATLQAFGPRPRPALAAGLEPLRAHAWREEDLALAQVTALASELDPLGLATLLRRALGDL